MTDILLDSGASRTMIQLDLMPQGKMMEGNVLVQCAHGNCVKCPLADVCMGIGHKTISARVVDYWCQPS